ncbi:MAG: zf-HC2 domain-containing protein [Actinobacteria bacterium]|nr:zf-HC2 domain-containing protein [Actinomycetota bacterium]
MPSHCERARQWVSAELDGRLSEFEHALLGAHLADCGSCRGFRTSLLRFTEELRSAPPERLERPVEVTHARRRISFRIAPAVAALAVTAVGLGSILASSNVRTGSAVSQSPESSSAPRLSPTNGPVNLSSLSGLRRDRVLAAATTVDTKQIQRPSSGGTVLR